MRKENQETISMGSKKSCLSLHLQQLDDAKDEMKTVKIGEEPTETEELVGKKHMETSVYWRYFRAGESRFMLFATMLCFVVAQGLLSASTYWVAYW